MQPQIERWRNELKELTDDVIDLVENQHIYHRIGEIIAANPKISQDNFFWDHLRANYGAAMVVGIARQVDERRDVISLMRLLKDIERNASIITKQWFADRYEATLPRQIGERDFAENFGSGESLDPAIMRKDITDFSLITANVEKFRHTRIAHKNKDHSLRINLSFREVDDALTFLKNLIIKYQLLLNQSGMPDLMPVIQYDWEAILRVPWIEKK